MLLFSHSVGVLASRVGIVKGRPPLLERLILWPWSHPRRRLPFLPLKAQNLAETVGDIEDDVSVG